MAFIKTDYGMNTSSWIVLGILSLIFHTLLSIPILIWAIRTVWQHQNETFFKSRKKLLIKLILIYSIFMIVILRPIELIVGPLRSIIFHRVKIPEFVVSWITFITMNTSSFVVIQLYVLRAWIYFFNIQSVLALQDKLWEKTLYSTNYDNWYLKSNATYGNVKFCSKIISIFSAFFVIILCIIREIDPHSKGYIAVIFGFQCSLIILFIILFVVIANIYSVNDLFALRNELKFDLITLLIIFIFLCCITILFWNHYQLIWFTFLELTSALQLIQSVMPCFWFFRARNKKLNRKKPKESPVSSLSPCASPNKLRLWWLKNGNLRSNSNNPKTETCAQTALQISASNSNNPNNRSHSQLQAANVRSLKFEDVVSDARGFREFIKFLSLSFSSENMLFIAEVMRHKNFMFMRGLVEFEAIGYYLDLPSKVIDYMWYVPDEYKNLNHARKARKKRKSLQHSRKAMSFSNLYKQKRDSLSMQTKSCPAVNMTAPETKFAFSNQIKLSQIIDDPQSTMDNEIESKHKKRIQWIDKQKRKKNMKPKNKNLREKKREVENDTCTDLGVMSDIEDNLEIGMDLVMVTDDEHSVSLKESPRLTAMISPKLLEATIMKNTDDDTDISMRLHLNINPIDIPASDVNDADTELTPNDMSPRYDDFKIDDFFQGFDDKQINDVLITPLEDAQRIRDRYIVNGAEFQINLSGGTQYQTLQHFANDPQHIDWKAKMLERKQKRLDVKTVRNGTNLPIPNVPTLKNIPTDTVNEDDSSLKTIKICTPATAVIAGERKEEKEEIKVEDIILRFDAACNAIISQLLLHEFDRFRRTDDCMAYFKQYHKSRKRLGSIYKKFQKKTSHILPMNHHQSPQLKYIKQLSLNKQNSVPRLTPLNKNAKAKSAGFMRESQLQLQRFRHTRTDSFGKSMAKHAVISHIPEHDAHVHGHGTTQSLELSNNLSTTFSGIFTNSKVRDSNTLTVTENRTSNGSNKNKLALIRELPQPVEVEVDKNKILSVITPPVMTPVVGEFDYPDIAISDAEEEEEKEQEEVQDNANKKKEMHNEMEEINL